MIEEMEGIVKENKEILKEEFPAIINLFKLKLQNKEIKDNISFEVTSPIKENEQKIKIELIHKPKTIYNRLNYELKIYKNELKNEKINLKIEKIEKNDEQKEIEYQEFSKKYVEFRRNINLTEEKKSVNNFELQSFFYIFLHDHTDDSIEYFISKLIDDPMVYEKKEKKIFFQILIAAYFFAVRNSKENVKKLKNKIQFNINTELNANDWNGFELYPIEDEVIDTIVITYASLGSLYKEAIFLNYFYRKYVRNDKCEAAILIEFLKRFNCALKEIDDRFFIDFARIVLLHETVIFHTAEEEDIIKIYFSRSVEK